MMVRLKNEQGRLFYCCRSDRGKRQKAGRTGVRRETPWQFFTGFGNEIGTRRKVSVL